MQCSQDRCPYILLLNILPLQQHDNGGPQWGADFVRQLLPVFEAYSTIGNHFSFKDRQPLLCKSNLVYKYTCERCQAFYIGKTKQQLAARISEHSGISARTGKKLAKTPKSDIYDHCQKCNVHVNPENFTIIDTLQTDSGLLILESLHQKTKKPTIGVMAQSTPLMSFD